MWRMIEVIGPARLRERIERWLGARAAPQHSLAFAFLAVCLFALYWYGAFLSFPLLGEDAAALYSTLLETIGDGHLATTGFPIAWRDGLGQANLFVTFTFDPFSWLMLLPLDQADSFRLSMALRAAVAWLASYGFVVVLFRGRRGLALVAATLYLLINFVLTSAWGIPTFAGIYNATHAALFPLLPALALLVMRKGRALGLADGGLLVALVFFLLDYPLGSLIGTAVFLVFAGMAALQARPAERTAARWGFAKIVVLVALVLLCPAPRRSRVLVGGDRGLGPHRLRRRALQLRQRLPAALHVDPCAGGVAALHPHRRLAAPLEPALAARAQDGRGSAHPRGGWGAARGSIEADGARWRSRRPPAAAALFRILSAAFLRDLRRLRAQPLAGAHASSPGRSASAPRVVGGDDRSPPHILGRSAAGGRLPRRLSPRRGANSSSRRAGRGRTHCRMALAAPADGGCRTCPRSALRLELAAAGRGYPSRLCECHALPKRHPLVPRSRRTDHGGRGQSHHPLSAPRPRKRGRLRRTRRDPDQAARPGLALQRRRGGLDT